MKKNIIFGSILLASCFLGSAFAEPLNDSSTLCNIGEVLKTLSTNSSPTAMRFESSKSDNHMGLAARLESLAKTGDHLSISVIKKAGPNEQQRVSVSCSNHDYNFSCLQTKDATSGATNVMCFSDKA